MKAIEKRPVPHEQVDKMVETIEERLRREVKEEIESSIIGEYVMEELRKLDQVAYIRFASVYRAFTDASSFEEEIKNLIEQTTGEKNK